MSVITLRDAYTKELAPALQKELGVKNVMAVPRIEKVTVAVGVGKIARKGGTSGGMDDAKIKVITENIAAITGQAPYINNAKKAISNFKLRAGMPIGVTVTLRGKKAFDFLSRLVNITLPRVRDFRGINGRLDGHGNYSLGLRDHSVFPEIRPEKTEFTHGISITVTTTTSDDAAAKLLLTKLGFPFKKAGN